MASRPFDFEAFIQSAGDAIVAAGTDGSILLWNRAAERIFGYTEAEALDHSLDLIIPEHLRIPHWEGYRRVMQTSDPLQREVLRVPAVHKNRRRLSIAFIFGLLLSPTQEIQAMPRSSVTRPAAGPKERALRQRLAELKKNKG